MFNLTSSGGSLDSTTNMDRKENNPQKCYLIKNWIPLKNDDELLISQGGDLFNMSLSTSNRGMQSMHSAKNEEQFLKRGPLSRSQENLFVVSAEKSYADASQKIIRMKQQDLDNKNHLLQIENDRLNNFLNDTVEETKRLNDKLNQCKTKMVQEQEKYSVKLNILIFDNQKLDEVNRKLQIKLNDIEEAKQDYHNVFEEASENNIQSINRTNQSRDLQEDYKMLQNDNQDLENRLNLLIIETTNLSSIMRNKDDKIDQLKKQIQTSSNDYQMTIEEFDKEMRHVRLAEQQKLEDLQNKYQMEVSGKRQQTFQEMNDQLEEICAELGTKEQRIRNLEKDCQTQQQFNETARNQNNELKQQEKDAQSRYCEERDVLLTEIDSLRNGQDQYESTIVKHNKTLISQEQIQKQMKSQFQELQREVQNTKKDLQDSMIQKDMQISSYRSKLDIILSENESLQTQIRYQQRQYDTIQMEVNTQNLEFEMRLKNAKIELNNDRDKQLDETYNEQLEFLRKEQKAKEILEIRLTEQKQHRTSLEGQLTQLIHSDKLTDQKMKELLKQCEILEQANIKNKDLCFKSQQDFKVATNKLKYIDNNHQLEKEDLRNQRFIAIEQSESLRLENQSIQIELTQTLSKCEKLRQDQDDLQFTYQRIKVDYTQLSDKHKQLEKESNKINEQIVAYKHQLFNQQNEFNQVAETNNMTFKEREADLMSKIKEQQFYVEQVTNKYNDILNKAKKYQQHIVSLRDSSHTSHILHTSKDVDLYSNDQDVRNKRNPQIKNMSKPLKSSLSTNKINTVNQYDTQRSNYDNHAVTFKTTRDYRPTGRLASLQKI